jgi:hypothetical protein
MRRFAVVVTTTVLVLGLQGTAAMAGGNWLDFRRADGGRSSTLSPWGVAPVGESLVARTDYLQRFFDTTDRIHLWLERGEGVRPGAPIPESAIRLATFQMSAGGTGGHAAFVVPSVPSGQYTLTVCDKPCTDEGFGFGESVMGWLTVVQTSEEARLLARVRELRDTFRSRVRDLRRDLRSADSAVEELTSELNHVRGALDESRAEVGRLTRAAERAADRTLIDGAAGGWIGLGLAAVAAGLLWRRRRSRVVVPDTPEELLEHGFGPAERRT